MWSINISNVRANLYNIIKAVIQDGDKIVVNTKEGNAVILSEIDYNSLIETLHLSTDPVYKKNIIETANAPQKEFVNEKDVEW